MSARFLKAAAAVVLTAILLATTAAAQAVSASVVMKVSKTAQDSVINEGEDLSIAVDIDGVNPASYRWYFGDEVIAGADYPLYSIVSATTRDAGVYRIEAFDDDGGMLISMAFNVRVMEKAMPKSGDGTLDAGLMIGAIAAAGLTGGAVIARKRRAA